MSNTNTDIVSRNEIGFTTEMISITYSNLVNLRDNSLLVPGQKYRIIDYVTTTTQAYTRVPGSSDVDTANYEPVFDVIVEANSVNTLSENAGAIQRVGNLRFANSKVESWKLRYCLDNDTDRFAWADSTNGKGVIYSMEDEFENKCGYDFKSIQFQRYKITAKTDSKKTDDLVGKYQGMRQLDQSSFLPSGYTISSSDYKWFYTFGVDEGNDPGASKSDKSMNKNGTTSQCFSNEIDPLFGNYNNNVNTHKQYLNQIVFLNDASNSSAINSKTSSNKFGGRCHTMTFGNYCNSNSFGNDCYYNSFGNNCYKYINISFSGKQIKLGFNGDSDYGFINTGDQETGKISISGTIYNNFDVDKTVHIEIEFAYNLEDDDEEYYETVSKDFLVSANSDLDFEVAFEEAGAAFDGFNANGTATFQVGNRTITSEGYYDY